MCKPVIKIGETYYIVYFFAKMGNKRIKYTTFVVKNIKMLRMESNEASIAFEKMYLR